MEMNVSEEQLAEYIDIFHSTLKVSSEHFIPHDLNYQIFHTSLLPAKITGYISTQFGVAIEYQPARVTTINTVQNSARIEHIIFSGPPKMRKTAPPFVIGGPNTVFNGFTMKGVFPFILDNEEASISLIRFGVEWGSWKRSIYHAEVFGDRTAENWSVEKALSRALDEVYIAKTELERADKKGVTLDYYIDNYKKNTVLILGDYDAAGLLRLGCIGESLKSLGYEPILVRDVPDHPHHSMSQKVVAIGAISRFVVVDDSSKSGHLYEVALCEQNKWVTVLLRAGGRAGSWMTAGASHSSNVILEASYDAADPKVGVAEAVAWAEEKLEELERKFQSTFPWRQKGS